MHVTVVLIGTLAATLIGALTIPGAMAALSGQQGRATRISACAVVGALLAAELTAAFGAVAVTERIVSYRASVQAIDAVNAQDVTGVEEAYRVLSTSLNDASPTAAADLANLEQLRGLNALDSDAGDWEETISTLSGTAGSMLTGWAADTLDDTAWKLRQMASSVRRVQLVHEFVDLARQVCEGDDADRIDFPDNGMAMQSVPGEYSPKVCSGVAAAAKKFDATVKAHDVETNSWLTVFKPGPVRVIPS